MSSPEESATAKDERESCVPTLSRKKFVEKILKGSVLAGKTIVGAKILDSFLLPSAYASASVSCNTSSNPLNGDTNGNCDIAAINNGTFTTNGTCNDTGGFIRNEGSDGVTCNVYFASFTTVGAETLCGVETTFVPTSCYTA